MATRTATFDKLLAIKHLLAYTDHILESMYYTNESTDLLMTATQLRREIMATMNGDFHYHCRLKHVLGVLAALEEVYEAEDKDVYIDMIKTAYMLVETELKSYTGEESKLCDRCAEDLNISQTQTSSETSAESLDQPGNAQKSSRRSIKKKPKNLG